MDTNKLDARLALAMIDDLEDAGIVKVFAEGEIILDENDSIQALPLLKSGAVRVMRSDDEGREILLYYITPGESCIMSFLGGIHHDTSKIKAVAEEKCQILFIPIHKLSVLLKDHPDLLDYIFRLYHKRFEELLEVVNEVAFKKMDERLLSLIRKKCELNQSHNLYVTHEDLARELGTARVVVSRLLKQMESESLVKLSRNKISLV